jgi:hypothetical protein
VQATLNQAVSVPAERAGPPLDDVRVVQPLQVLDVEGGDDGDARVEQFVDVLPALLVPAAGLVGVGELVDQGDGGGAGEQRVEVHVGERAVPVFDRAAGQHR